MPEFANPFPGKIPERKLTKAELIRAIRLDIAAEHEAVHLYMAHADAIDHPLAKKILIDIANEEREHIGEFMQLLEILTGDESKWLENGREEVAEMAEDFGLNVEGDEPTSTSAQKPGTTIGSLRDE